MFLSARQGFGTEDRGRSVLRFASNHTDAVILSRRGALPQAASRTRRAADDEVRIASKGPKTRRAGGSLVHDKYRQQEPAHAIRRNPSPSRRVPDRSLQPIL